MLRAARESRSRLAPDVLRATVMRIDGVVGGRRFWTMKEILPQAGYRVDVSETAIDACIWNKTGRQGVPGDWLAE